MADLLVFVLVMGFFGLVIVSFGLLWSWLATDQPPVDRWGGREWGEGPR